MSDYSSLKATINANIKANNNHEITGAITNSVLNAMVDSLGAGYQYKGVATPTNPGSAQTPDYKCFYIATTPGTYTNLGGLVVADGEVAILKYDSSWTKEVTGAATADQLNQLGQYVENPEFVEVHTDSEDKVLYGVKQDGDFHFGAGIPSQVQESINKIASIKVDKAEVNNLNNPLTRKVGYELSVNGVYSPSGNYTSSGDIAIGDKGTYETDYTGNIYCYNSDGFFISRVSSGSELPVGTAFVRINWLTSSKAPYFYSEHSASIQSQIDNASESEKKDNYDLNNPLTIKNGYELNYYGQYATNQDYSASGNIKVAESLQYSTNYTGSVYCYDSKGNYLNRVTAGQSLVPNTAFVRLNWKTADGAPYFYSDRVASLQSQLVENTEKIYRINGEDILGYELSSPNGRIAVNNSWRVSQLIKMEVGKNYACNISANYYYYDSDMQFLGTVNTSAGSTFNRNSKSGAVYMRTNASISTPIIIYGVDLNGNKLINREQFVGTIEREQEIINSSNANVNVALNSSVPNRSSNIEIRFKTLQSFYKQNSTVKLISLGGLVDMSLSPVELSDSYYCDKSEVNFVVRVGMDSKTIPLRLNNYGKDLFSIKPKYPVVNVATDGTTTMVTAMPSFLEGAYIEKTATNFTIYNGDSTVYKSFVLSNYSDVDAFVEALKVDSDITTYFDVVKYGCEGISFAEINNFSKIYLTKEVQEIYYDSDAQGQPVYTGNEYWDAYPTIIRSSDVGYEHILKFNYRIINNHVGFVYVSLDGMFVKFYNTQISIANDTEVVINDTIVDSSIKLSILPYKPASTPLLSMQHRVVVGDSILGETGKTTTMRLYDMLAYFKRLGFIGQNIEESLSTITGINSIEKPAYCLTFDDRQDNLWRDERIRNIFNQFKASPTLVYILYVSEMAAGSIPLGIIQKEEYDAMKATGWGFISHGFSLLTNYLSYAQFKYGFELTKEKWLDWYNEDVTTYNPHGEEILDYQFYLLKHLGFSSICSGSAHLGWYCESGTTIDIQYKRETLLDSEKNWNTVVKPLIDDWATM